MMDSQDNILQEEIKDENKVVDTTEVTNEQPETEPAAEVTAEQAPVSVSEPRKQYTTKEEVHERVNEIAHSDEVPAKD